MIFFQRCYPLDDYSYCMILTGSWKEIVQACTLNFLMVLVLEDGGTGFSLFLKSLLVADFTRCFTNFLAIKVFVGKVLLPAAQIHL